MFGGRGQEEVLTQVFGRNISKWIGHLAKKKKSYSKWHWSRMVWNLWQQNEMSQSGLGEDGDHTVPHSGKFIHRLSNYQLLIILPCGVNYKLNSFCWTLLPVVFHPSPPCGSCSGVTSEWRGWGHTVWGSVTAFPCNGTSSHVTDSRSLGLRIWQIFSYTPRITANLQRRY